MLTNTARAPLTLGVDDFAFFCATLLARRIADEDRLVALALEGPS